MPFHTSALNTFAYFTAVACSVNRSELPRHQRGKLAQRRSIRWQTIALVWWATTSTGKVLTEFNCGWDTGDPPPPHTHFLERKLKYPADKKLSIVTAVVHLSTICHCNFHDTSDVECWVTSSKIISVSAALSAITFKVFCVCECVCVHLQLDATFYLSHSDPSDNSSIQCVRSKTDELFILAA